MQINFAAREVNCKIVYYGPGRSGKTTNLEVVHAKAPPDSKGELVSIATETDRTLYFDFLPLDLGQIAGMSTKFQLYTVPGQVFYNATRKLVLQGSDGVIFVADSNPDMREENIESIENLAENLRENGIEIETVPLVFQWNKRDMPNAMTPEEMNRDINRWGAPSTEAVAVKGEGVFPTLKLMSSIIIKKLNEEYAGGKSASAPKPAAAPAPAARPAAPPPRPAGTPPAPAPAPRPAAAPAPAPRPAAPPPRPASSPPPPPAARPAAPPPRPAAPPSRPAAPPPRPAAAGAAAGSGPRPGPSTTPMPAPRPVGATGPMPLPRRTNPLAEEIRRRKEVEAKKVVQAPAPVAAPRPAPKKKKAAGTPWGLVAGVGVALVVGLLLFAKFVLNVF